jgi:wyosine [tRNA(Phe)-imidazoG37] synthetase (radical SAM superfamily)
MTPEEPQRDPGRDGSPDGGGHLPDPTVVEETAFGHPKDYLGNRFVYLVISPRAGGLSVGVNLNPDKRCDFDCVYCEVDRQPPGRELQLDVEVMAAELKTMLASVHEGCLRELPYYRELPAELLELRHVALSGDGEPTLCPHFLDAVRAVAHVRAVGSLPFFKMVLITNGSGLDQPEVKQGLAFFSRSDEIWVKLDGGTQAYLERVNRLEVPIEKILENILGLARRRPVVIQSLFPALNGTVPSEEEIREYAQRLKVLKAAGAQIEQVQIYSATRPMARPECGHLPLRVLSGIARVIRSVAGLKAEVF